MSEKLSLWLKDKAKARELMTAQLFPFLNTVLESGKTYMLTVKQETRSQAQNRLMWPLLECFSKQLQWPVNGAMVDMEPQEWKDVLTAAFRRESVRVAMGLDGGVVMLGLRTSAFTKAEFGEWIEFLYATAAARGVNLPAWTEEK
jgi:hypothetical protein